MARVRPGQRIKQAETVAPTSPTKAMRLGPATSLEGSRTSLIHLSQCPYQSSGASARSQNRRDDGDVVPRRRQRSGQEFQSVEGVDGGEHVHAFPDGSLETSPDELVTSFTLVPKLPRNRESRAASPRSTTCHRHTIDMSASGEGILQLEGGTAMTHTAVSAETDLGATRRTRSFLKDEAYDTIRDYLLGEEDGGMLSERILAARLGLGLGPLRSALERLRAEGLIAVAPNSGLRLPEITAREIIDFYEMRMVVECHIAAHLAGRLSDEQSAQIERVLTEQEHAARVRDTIRYHRLDLDFHTSLTECHGNPEMVRALGQLRNKMHRLSRRLHRTHPERLAVNAAQHRGIVEAIRSGDADEARGRMSTHLVWGRAFTLDPDGRLAKP